MLTPPRPPPHPNEGACAQRTPVRRYSIRCSVRVNPSRVGVVGIVVVVVVVVDK